MHSSKRAVRATLAAPVNPAWLGGACTIEGDLFRLAGGLDGAETAYSAPTSSGWDPQPSLSLLRFAQGRIDVADAMIRRVVGEPKIPSRPARVLGPYVEIVLAQATPRRPHGRRRAP